MEECLFGLTAPEQKSITAEESWQQWPEQKTDNSYIQSQTGSRGKQSGNGAKL